ncbi:unnamed protein product [Rhizophagus irregularis]|nr:unnamed protein product [Rhizophagus irregularis]
MWESQRSTAFASWYNTYISGILSSVGPSTALVQNRNNDSIHKSGDDESKEDDDESEDEVDYSQKEDDVNLKVMKVNLKKNITLI